MGQGGTIGQDLLLKKIPNDWQMDNEEGATVYVEKEEVVGWIHLLVDKQDLHPARPSFRCALY